MKKWNLSGIWMQLPRLLSQVEPLMLQEALSFQIEIWSVQGQLWNRWKSSTQLESRKHTYSTYRWCISWEEAACTQIMRVELLLASQEEVFLTVSWKTCKFLNRQNYLLCLELLSKSILNSKKLLKSRASSSNSKWMKPFNLESNRNKSNSYSII